MVIGKELEFRDCIGDIKSDIVKIVEMKLTKDIKSYMIFPDGCTEPRKERR